MNTLTQENALNLKSSAIRHRGFRFVSLNLVAGLMALVTMTGCQTSSTAAPTGASQTSTAEAQVIREGDVIKISFPGAPNLDAQQTVRRDGRVTLAMIGEVKAAGKTPSELENTLLQTFGSQLVSKEVTVSVVSSSFFVFVSGAVIHPGKITADHALTALEAVMEAGGFDNAKANTSAVVVIRSEDGKTKNYTLNLQQVLDGQSSDPFYLKQSDIIVVKEKFSWF